jgi:hypothetical protein
MLAKPETPAPIVDLIRRIEILERRLHWQRALCVALALAAALAMLSRGGEIAGLARADDEPPRTITARQVILVDEDGKKRVLVSGLKEMPGVFVMDAEEKQRAAIVLSPEGPAMYLCDPDGTKRVYCDVGRSPVLGIADESGAPRAVVGLFDGKPALNVYAPRSNRPAAKP